MNLLADKHKNTVDFDLKSTVFVTLIDYRDRTADLLQSMHGALPAELNPHSVGLDKKAPHISVRCFLFWWRLPGSNR